MLVLGVGGTSSPGGRLAGVGGCCMMVGTGPCAGNAILGANSVVGLRGGAMSRCRFSSALKAASHLISSSSLGAQRTNVRLAVTILKRCSSTEPPGLSGRFELMEGSRPRMLNCRVGLIEAPDSDRSSISESDGSVTEPSGSNSRASSTAVRGTKRIGRESCT